MASGNRKGGGLFSLQGKERGADIGNGVKIPEPAYATSGAHTPYGAAWREFDRPQKAAKHGGWINMTHWWFGGIPGLVSLFDPHKHAKSFERGLTVAFFALAIVQGIRSRWAAARLAHWPCPRCHVEWPGKKSQKDPQCNLCGLKLHQLMP